MALDAAYRGFVAAHPEATLWHDPAFLRALAPDSDRAGWEVAAVTVQDVIVAALPYYRKRRADGWVVTLPPLIRYCGPLVDPAWQRAVGREHALEQLLGAVPGGYRSFDQTWPNGRGDALPDSFELASRTTHHIDFGGQTTVGTLQSAQKSNMRADLRRAERHLGVRFAEAISADIHDVLEAPFARQAVPVPYARENLQAAFALLRRRGHASCACAYDAAGELNAVSVFVRGTNDAYALAVGSTDVARKYSGGSLVVWRGITWALEQGVRRLDFLGSDHPGIAANFRHLGGRAVEYVHVYRDNVFWTKALRSWRNRAKSD